MYTITATYDKNLCPARLDMGQRRSKRYVYALSINGKIFYIGESADPVERLTSHTYDTKHLNRAAVEGVKYLRELHKSSNVEYHMSILETIDVDVNEDGSHTTAKSKAAEQHHILMLRNAGHPITNR